VCNAGRHNPGHVTGKGRGDSVCIDLVDAALCRAGTEACLSDKFSSAHSIVCKLTLPTSHPAKSLQKPSEYSNVSLFPV
jgi:hypothetical protein